jgi:hypothetical protein
MEFVCDAPGGKTWFRIETEGEAAIETTDTNNPVETYFCDERKAAAKAYRPSPRLSFIERDIGLNAHLSRTMPLFLTLRDRAGAPLATAVLPPGGRDDARFLATIVAPDSGDPFPSQGAAIAALEKHFGLALHAAQDTAFDATLPFQTMPCVF